MNFANDNAKRDALIIDWQDKQNARKKAEEEEMKARLAVVAFFHEDTTDKAGTENVDIGQGFTLKMEFRQNYSVPSAKNGEAAKGVMSKLTALGAEGAAIAQRIFRWKPELSKTEYDLLSPQAKRIVDKVVTQKAGTPALTIVPPKV